MRCKAAAKDLDCLVQIHASEAPFEVDAIMERHGRTSIEWLDDMGFLDERTIVGHCVFTSESSWMSQSGSDIEILAATGASVAYNPWCYLRQGVLLESFPRYEAAGINMCLGTDAVPQSMVESMRFAALSGKVMERRPDAMTARSAFNAATINAANMLRRPDLGRLAEGAKADIVAWSTNTMRMVPLVDPIRNLVYYAGSSEVRDVMIDGRWVVEDGAPKSVDLDAVLTSVQGASERIRARYHENDWAHRSFAEVYPPTFEPFVA
jgi:cytosine/adenosine deaminase-related metal-dependent hydrolase